MTTWVNTHLAHREAPDARVVGSPCQAPSTPRQSRAFRLPQLAVWGIAAPWRTPHCMNSGQRRASGPSGYAGATSHQLAAGADDAPRKNDVDPSAGQGAAAGVHAWPAPPPARQGLSQELPRPYCSPGRDAAARGP
eukprot:scaffold22678_cov65-Phaeocystis_antarctica.AAC.3